MAGVQVPTDDDSSAPSIPVAIGDIDTAWLMSALRPRLAAGVVLRSFSVEPIGVGVGLLGLLFRLTLEYEGDSSGTEPSTVIVKLPVLIDETRHVAKMYRFYEKEVGFYRELAADSSLRTPEVYFADHAPATDNFVLVMEDP
jgi:hypothetical protein